ncbi:MAG TPA: protease complex subunit PrcB family protein [Thermoanaerobaculia bacterium]
MAAPVEIATIARGGYATAETRQAVLATSDADYRKQWQALIGEGQIPTVDFDSHVVVFLFAGMRNTGGWSVVPVSARVEGDTAIVDAKVEGPPPGGITTQAITYPYAVITINRRDVARVRWD